MLLLLVLLFAEIQDGVDVTRVTVRIPNLFKIRQTLFYGCKVKFLKDHVSVSGSHHRNRRRIHVRVILYVCLYRKQRTNSYEKWILN
ncbi:hypothetical protein Hdeb2414_s0001g00012171 [Helianthus debilis subsp. tardiflorus]